MIGCMGHRGILLPQRILEMDIAAHTGWWSSRILSRRFRSRVIQLTYYNRWIYSCKVRLEGYTLL